MYERYNLTTETTGNEASHRHTGRREEAAHPAKTSVGAGTLASSSPALQFHPNGASSILHMASLIPISNQVTKAQF